MKFTNNNTRQINYDFAVSKSCRNITIIICYLLLLPVKLSSQSEMEFQDQTGDQVKSSITWVATIPDKTVKDSKNIFSRIGNIVFGEEPPLLQRPVSVTATDITRIWIADQGKGEIVLTGNGQGSGSSFFNQKDKKLASITGICITPGEKILFTDSGTNGLYKKSDRSNYSLINDTIKLLQPTGVAWSPVTGEVWVIETKAHSIAVLNNDGVRVRSIGQRGTGPGEFNFPTHIWIDNDGKAYITDALNYRIQVFDRYGNFIFCFGEQGDATGYFARPKGIATDSMGNIYIADALFNAIQVFDKTGKFAYYFGSQGTGREQFWMPNGIFIDKNDFLYIADSYNSRIQIFKIDTR